LYFCSGSAVRILVVSDKASSALPHQGWKRCRTKEAEFVLGWHVEPAAAAASCSLHVHHDHQDMKAPQPVC
jgi:hypothetical protein